jgi:single-stranded-DNA-specific exonuclease
MHDFFKKIGYKNVMFYIPHRHTEGYGLHLDALDKIAAEGATLMITVDLGNYCTQGSNLCKRTWY